MVTQLTIGEAVQKHANERAIFVGRLSFEQRSAVLPGAFSGCTSETILFYTQDASATSRAVIDSAKSTIANGTFVELDIQRPEHIVETFLSTFSRENIKSKKYIVDVSSFRREELLILLRIFSLHCADCLDATILYVKADEMSRDWLTRSVAHCRSVIGFSGDMSLSAKTHLVIMLGFEVERAREIIETYEPDQLTIGIGREGESINSELYQRNVQFLNTMNSMYDNSFDRFDFSLIDPCVTAEDLSQAIKVNEETNIIIAPLNNKISTLGAGIFAIKNPSVQLCYSQVTEYNESDYSKPGTTAIELHLRDIMGAAGISTCECK